MEPWGLANMHARDGVVACACALALVTAHGRVAAAAEKPAAGATERATDPAARTVEGLLDAIADLGGEPLPSSGQPVAPAQQKALRTVRATLDMPAIARFGLGSAWGGLGPQQRKQFLDLLTQVIERRALPKAGAFFEDVTVSIGDVEHKDREARVTTTAESKTEGKVIIEYVLAEGAGGFKVEDVILDRVSLRTNLRSQVQKVIADDSFAELLAKMRRKLAGEEEVGKE
jgi:phospholipid transport system substrate-binding protein